MAQTTGTTIIPAGSTVAIPVTLPFAPTGIQLRATAAPGAPSDYSVSSPTFATIRSTDTPQSCIGKKISGGNLLEKYFPKAFQPADFGANECAGDIVFTPTGFTVSISWNNSTAPTTLQWFAHD